MENIESLRIPIQTKLTGLSTFRQRFANGRIKNNLGFLSVEPKEDDLPRVHDIVNEIDNRRVFYQAYEDVIPEFWVKSVHEVREAIQELRKGVWVDIGTRAVVQPGRVQ